MPSPRAHSGGPRRRIDSFADRARVEGYSRRRSAPLPAPDDSSDRFISASAFDHLAYEYAAQLIDEAHRLLIPAGVTFLASLTAGQSIPAPLMSRSWHGIWRLAPRLVGGGRPAQVRAHHANRTGPRLGIRSKRHRRVSPPSRRATASSPAAKGG